MRQSGPSSGHSFFLCFCCEEQLRTESRSRQTRSTWTYYVQSTQQVQQVSTRYSEGQKRGCKASQRIEGVLSILQRSIATYKTIFSSWRPHRLCQTSQRKSSSLKNQHKFNITAATIIGNSKVTQWTLRSRLLPHFTANQEINAESPEIGKHQPGTAKGPYNLCIPWWTNEDSVKGLGSLTLLIELCSWKTVNKKQYSENSELKVSVTMGKSTDLKNSRHLTCLQKRLNTVIIAS